MADKRKDEPFEDIYARLEESVAKLEAGGLPLDRAIALYEEGMTLARLCQERLDEAEQKITKLKESFAPIPARANGNVIGDTVAEYEYIPEQEDPPPDDDPFA